MELLFWFSLLNSCSIS